LRTEICIMRKAKKTLMITLLSVLIFAATTIPVYIAYARRTFTIDVNLSPVDAGEITGDPYPVVAGTVEVPNNQDQTITIEPNPGYRLLELEIDGVSVGVDNGEEPVSYTFTKVRNEHTITAIFDVIDIATSFSEGNAETSERILLTTPQFLPELIDGVTPYYQVEITEGTFSGTIIITVRYDDSGMDPEDEQNLRLYIGNPVDFDENGTVNGNDIALIQEEAKSADPDLDTFDLNHDGVVDAFDVNIVKEYANSGLIVNPGQDNAGQFRIPWVDITKDRDTELNIVVGETWHLSLFGIR